MNCAGGQLESVQWLVEKLASVSLPCYVIGIFALPGWYFYDRRLFLFCRVMSDLYTF